MSSIRTERATLARRLGLLAGAWGLAACTAGTYRPMVGDAPAAASPAGVSAPDESSRAAPSASPASADLEPFTLQLEGTAVQLAMLPLALPSGEALWMSATEIPWEAFDVYVYGYEIPRERRVAEFDAASRPSKPYGSPDRGWGHEGYPALSMTALSAERFCDWLGERAGAELRLPTVEEWEFAARGGSPEPAPVSLADPDRVLPQDLGTAVGWAPANGPRTVALDELEANALGFSGLLGNLGEWARLAADDAGAHVLCGGHFLDSPQQRTAGRREVQQPSWNQTDPQNPKSRWWLSDAPFVGFRIVALSPPELP